MPSLRTSDFNNLHKLQPGYPNRLANTSVLQDARTFVHNGDQIVGQTTSLSTCPGRGGKVLYTAPGESGFSTLGCKRIVYQGH